MGLKFRRGTTAQQSGSLAFGEPYVNTTLGTLVVGGATGDIILSTTGTGSTGTFGAISGSGIDITGNANFGGDVTIGGRIANSVNNIRTLGVNGTGYAGLSTANASTQLYATEADGTTINTGIVNQYGYRAYHTGTATAIFDPAKTYAYVSELPIVNNNQNKITDGEKPHRGISSSSARGQNY